MLIFPHKFLNILVLLILKCFCHAHTYRQSYKSTHSPVCSLPYLHTSSVGAPALGQPVHLPKPDWCPCQWESTPGSGSHTPSVFFCVLHHILVLQHLGTGTSHQFTGCDDIREQQALLLPLQGLSSLLKKYSYFFYISFQAESFVSNVSLWFPGYCLIWLIVIIFFNMLSFGQAPSQKAPSQRVLGVPLTNTVYIHISALTSVVIQATGEPRGHSTPV